MSIAIVALILLIPLVILGIILLAVIPGQATIRNPDRTEGEGSDDPGPGYRGPGEE